MINEFRCFARQYLQSLFLTSGAIHLVDSDDIITASTNTGQVGSRLVRQQPIVRKALSVSDGSVWWLVVEDGRDEGCILAVKSALETAFSLIANNFEQASLSPEEGLVRSLLQSLPSSPDEAALTGRLKQSGLDVSQARTVMIIDVEEKVNQYFNVHLDLGYDTSVAKAKAELIQTIKANPFITTQDIVAQYGLNQVVIIKAFLRIPEQEKYYLALDRICETIFKDLESSRIFAVRAAYGSVYNGILNVRQSYKEAQVLMQLGSNHLGRNGLYKIENLLVEYMAASFPPAYVNKILHPMLAKLKRQGESAEQDLLQVMETFVDTGLSLKDTAQKLYLHRNTIAGKLERYKEITGMNPDENFSDALLTKLMAAYIRFHKK